MALHGGVPRIPAAFCHPLYLQMRDLWRYYELSYIGGSDYLTPDIRVEWVFVSYRDSNGSEVATEEQGDLNSFLFPYSREKIPFYRQRLRRSWYRNLCQPSLDTVRDHALGEGVDRDAGLSPAVAAVWEDVDHMGSTVDEWVKEGLTQAMTHGHVMGVVDLPRYLPGEVRTLKDEQALGVRPYGMWYTPLQMPNWDADRFGAFTRCEFLEEDQRPDTKGAPLWRILYRDRWEVREGGPEGTVIDEGPNPLGRVPVEVLRVAKLPGVKQPLGQSFLHAIAPLNQQLYNTDSMRDELKYRQGPFLGVPGGKGMSRMEIGLEDAFGLPENVSPPAWVTMPSHVYEVLSAQIAEFVLTIRALAGLSRGTSEQSISARSGEALLIETQDKRALLSGIRHEVEDFETRFAQLVADVAQQTWTGHVKYSDQYLVRSFTDDLEEATKFMHLPIPREAKNEVLAEMIRKRLKHLGAERIDALVRLLPEDAPVPLALAPPDIGGNGVGAPVAETLPTQE